RYGIPGRPARRAGIALIAELHEGDRHQRLAPGHREIDHAVDVRKAVRIAPEVRMETDVAADEVDVPGAPGIDRRRADVDVPPVVGREQRQRSGQWAARLGQGRRGDTGPEQTENEKAGGPPDVLIHS